MQGRLDFDSGPRDIVINGGSLTLHDHWLNTSEAQELFLFLSQQLHWEQSTIRIGGRYVSIPRLNAWYGDSNCHYQYSNHALKLNPWIPQLSALRVRLQKETGISFNSVLANLYRDGNDSVAWHSDDEPELGRDPVIASLSLGATRRFSLKHRHRRDLSSQHLDLAAGSLLIMSGQTQANWQHCLPKSKKITQPRINLTFRRIVLNSGSM